MTPDAGASFVEISGEPALISQLEGALLDALAGRRRHYLVNVTPVGRVGEVLIAIDGRRGHLPLILGQEDLEPGYVRGVVRELVERFAL
jgi:hypothetical protein